MEMSGKDDSILLCEIWYTYTNMFMYKKVNLAGWEQCGLGMNLNLIIKCDLMGTQMDTQGSTLRNVWTTLLCKNREN